MKHTKRRKLTVEDFNRALRWSSVEVSGAQAAEGSAGTSLPTCPTQGWPHSGPAHTQGKVTATAAQVSRPVPQGQVFREAEVATEARRLGKASWKSWHLS